MNNQLYMVFIILFFIQCQNSQEIRDSQFLFADEISKSWTIEYYESTKISDTLAWLTDVINDKVVGITKDRESIIEIDKKTYKPYFTKVVGEGPDRINALYKFTICPDDRIVTFSQGKLHVFNRRGEIVHTCQNLYSDINYDLIPISFCVENSIFLSSIDPNRSIDDLSYFNNEENFYFSEINLETCNISYHGKLNESSIYRHLFLPTRNRSVIVPHPNKNELLKFFLFDRLITFYDLEDFSKIREYELIPKEFGNISGAIDDELDEHIRIIQLNSAYLYMNVSKDNYLLTYYQKGTEQLASSTDYLNSNSQGRTRIFELYDLNTKSKLGELIDSKHYPPVKFISKDSIYFYSTKYQGNEGLYLHLGRVVDL